MRVIRNGLSVLLIAGAFACLPTRAQDTYPTFKVVIETFGVGRCLFMEGYFTKDQSSSFVSQYLNKKGVTGTQFKNITEMDNFEQNIKDFIKSAGGCKHIADEVLKGKKR